MTEIVVPWLVIALGALGVAALVAAGVEWRRKRGGEGLHEAIAEGVHEGLAPLREMAATLEACSANLDRAAALTEPATEVVLNFADDVSAEKRAEFTAALRRRLRDRGHDLTEGKA